MTSRQRRALAVLTLAAAGTIVPAAPASAHTGYCGHGVHWDWNMRVEFMHHYSGTTTHQAWVHEGWRAYTRDVLCGHRH